VSQELRWIHSLRRHRPLSSGLRPAGWQAPADGPALRGSRGESRSRGVRDSPPARGM